MYRWVILSKLHELFIWMGVCCDICPTMNKQKRTKIAAMTTLKKVIYQSGSFEDKVIFEWQPMGLFKNRRCPLVSVAVYDNPSYGVSSTLQFVHVETEQTSEGGIVVVKRTTHQGICCQDSSLIC